MDWKVCPPLAAAGAPQMSVCWSGTLPGSQAALVSHREMQKASLRALTTDDWRHNHLKSCKVTSCHGASKQEK